MARREVYERSGGYRTRMKRQEDAEFWCRVTSLGFRAYKFTEAVTYYHRERSDSKGSVEWKNQGKEPDWTSWFPWRMGGTDFQTARDIIRQRGDTPKNSHMVPFGAQGKPPKELVSWYVHDFSYPVVSIIVTCGPGHKNYLLDSLDSIQAQTFPDWECVVVNDTGKNWDRDIMGAPWAKVINMDGNKGAAAARNEGLKHVSGKWVIWMDADDYWLPWYLEKMVGYGEQNNGIIYSDILMKTDDEIKINRYKEFDSTLVINTMQYPGSSILIPIQVAYAMVEFQGGFDEQIPGMEDWDYQIGVHHLGVCAFHIPEPLFVYRINSSTKRDKDYAKIDNIVSFINRKWKVYREGEKQIMCGCRTPNKTHGQLPASLLSSSGDFSQESIMQAVETGDKTMMVTVEYIGPIKETFPIKSRVSRDVTYRFGNNDNHKTRAVFIGDAEYFLSRNDKEGNPTFRVISNIAVIEANDPTSFLGEPIVA
jgi:GT2 family glycosyltransferase